MAARKKANKKGASTVTKKTKAPSGSTAARKRKAAAATASRRTAAKAKTSRSAKAKTDKSEAKRRAARAASIAAAKRRAAHAAQSAEAAKHAAKPAKAEVAKPAVKPAPEVKAVRETAPSPRPAVAPAKPIAPLAKRAPLAEPEAAVGAKPAKPVAAPRPGFKVNEFVVYPAHGVGQIVAVEDQEVAGFHLELFVISFAKDKMTLRVPTAKVAGVGMRKLSEPDVARKSLEILTGRARIKRTMWSRRAQEYEAKINSGDINAIAEVVRDLYRSEAQPEQSYSERQLYEAALDRIMREIAAVQKLTEIEALKLIESHLKRSQRRAAKADGVEGDEAAVEEAA